MARSRKSRNDVTPPPDSEAPIRLGAPGSGNGVATPDPGAGGPETTGRYLVVFRDDVLDDPKAAMSALGKVAGIRDVAAASDYESAAIDMEEAAESEGFLFESLGVAVIDADDARVAALATAGADEESSILAIEPEYVFRAIQEAHHPVDLTYLRGYRDAVVHLYEQLAGTDEADQAGIAAVFADTPQLTWGLQATLVDRSRQSGQGIRVAVLDTGLDLAHPDFRGRAITAQSFIPGQTVQDVVGHGTHCAGTACGPQRPPSGVRRYGCAFNASVFVGKVLGDSGRSTSGSVVNGMNWAVTNGCHVISMSLGADIDQVSTAYETIGRRAMLRGSLIIAAAGNNARRPGFPGFVGQPANSPSIVAVGAVDNRLGIARFSAQSSTRTGDGGKVDIVGPGVDVFSSVPVSRGRHDSISGTSMATPHVAGIAAMWAQASGARGAALWNLLQGNALRLRLPSVDVGVGLVQAPG